MFMGCKFYKYLVLLVIILSGNGSAQNFAPFNVIHYDEKDGLPTNLIKKIKSDDLGFIWIASDGGLVRYDGNTFIVLSDILPSTYAKDVVFGKNQEVYVVTDFGFGEIINPRGNRNKISYKPIATGGMKEEQGHLYYPKSVFIDSKNNVWISGITSVNKIKGKDFETFVFPKKYHSDSYFSSYNIIETANGEIFISSWAGYILKYDSTSNSFVDQNIKALENTRIHHFYYDEGRIFAGTSEGVFVFSKSRSNDLELEKHLPLESISSISRIQEGAYMFGTWMEGVYFYDCESKSVKRVDLPRVRRIVSLTRDKYQGIWLASENGIFLLKEALFSQIDFSSTPDIDESPFIFKSVIADESNIYFSDQSRVFSIDIFSKKINRIDMPVDEEVYNFDARDEYLAISYRSGKLYFTDGKRSLVDRFKGDRINDCKIDSKGNLWGLLEQKGLLLKVSLSGEVKYYEYLYENDLMISLVDIVDDEVYVGLTGETNRIAKYSVLTDELIPVGTKIENGERYQLRIFDIEKKDNFYYLATNRSLLELHSDTVYQNVWMKNIESPNIRAIASGQNGELWLGTDRGVFLVTDDGTSQYSEADGLPNSTVTIEGLLVDGDNRLWVSTPGGLGVSVKEIFTGSITPEPIIIETSFYDANNRFVENKNREYYAGSDVNVVFSSLFYPTNDISYQYQLVGEDERWSSSTKVTSVRYNNLRANDYILRVRAKKDGHRWSAPAEFRFFIITPWYLKPGMIIVYSLLGVLIIILVLVLVNQKRLRNLQNQRKELEILVGQRTADLEEEKRRVERYLEESVKAGKELKRLNEFKGELLSIASHDLKNPLQSILGMEQILLEDRSIKGDSQEAVEIIFEASKNMHNLITEILDNSITTASDLSLNKTKANISDIVSLAVNQNKVQSDRKKQNLHVDIEENIETEIDKVWMRNVIDNLLSNAIKYTYPEKNIWIKLFRKNSQIVFSVMDQGQGFTDKDKEKVFKKFQRLSAKPTGNETSTGLGLFIVKEIVSKHGGNIELKSVLGEGSEFIITLDE
ncbi:MAG: hypothetical protein SCALA702_08550 [Melioribacteraceae bacterium]|nr:MAG: hypothetical protein SCALA702_08550 [Melioribacteraceae bacterium]